jgi:delta 1-pyrroline-5-carboxylate dehydrogenase
MPGSLRSIRLIGVDLGIDDGHRGISSVVVTINTAAAGGNATLLSQDE